MAPNTFQQVGFLPWIYMGLPAWVTLYIDEAELLKLIGMFQMNRGISKCKY